MLVVMALAAPVIVIACHDDSTDRSDAKGADVRGADVKFHARDTSRALGAGDVRIESSDNAIELALIGDSVVTGLGPAVRDKVNAKTDTAAVKGDGIGASIEKMVKSTVADALSHQLYFSIRDISDVRYENGRLQFYNVDGSKTHLFENTKVDGKDASTMFQKDDADKFIAAFHAKKAAMSN
jgi:hypothetical protein